MPAQKINLGLKGLNADISPYSLPPENWNRGLNLRVKDGSIQAVPSAQLYTDQPVKAIGLNALNPIKISQYVPDGAAYLNTIVVGLGATNQIGIYQSSNKSAQSATPFVAQYSLPTGVSATYNPQYSVDNFIFNELSIVNTKTSLPVYYNAYNPIGFNNTYKVLPDWATTGRTLVPNITVVSATATTVTFNASVQNIVYVNSYISPTTETGGSAQTRVVSISGATVTVEDASNFTAALALPSPINTLWQAFPYYARGMTQYNGRLIAFNLYLDRPDAAGIEEVSPIELAWSQPITSLQSLNGVQWNSAANNSAGNDYLTESPGEVLAALQLNEYLITYKSDSVYLYQDTGAPNYLVAKTLYTDDGIFNTKTVVSINSQQHFVVGNKGIYLHQGGVEKKNISRGRIEESFYRGTDGVDLNYRGIAFCYHNILEKEVWICYRSKDVLTPNITAGGIIGCNKAYCYNYLTDTWYQRSLDNVTDITDIDISGSTATVVAQPAVQYANAPSYLYQFIPVTSDCVGTFENTAYIQFDDRDLGTASVVKSFNAVYPHTDCAIKYQLKLTNAHKIVDWSTVTQRYFNPDSGDYRLDYRETGRFVHMRILGAGLTAADAVITNPLFSNLDADVELRGRR